MAKKTQDLKPDTVQKNYGSDNEQFADFFNAVLFEMHYQRKKTLIYVPCLMKSQNNEFVR